MTYVFSPEYFFIWIPVLFYAFFPKEKKLLTLYIMLAMAFLAMMRGLEVGTDHLGYEEDFYRIKSLENYENQMRHRFEWGYVACLLFFKQFSNDYLTFSALTFLPFFIGSMAFVKQRSRSIGLSLFVYWSLGFYLASYNIMRQFMCMAMIVPFVTWLDRKNGYIRFTALTIVLALLFHKSSLMMLGLIPLHWYCDRIESSNKKLLSVAVVSSFLVFWIGRTFFQGFFVGLNLFLGTSEFDGYITQQRVEVGGNMLSSFYTLYLLILIYVIDARKYKFELHVVVAAIVLYNIFNTMSIYASRVYWDYWLFAIVLIPNVMTDKNTRSRELFYIITILFCAGYFINFYVFGGMDGVNPYYFREL